jgi:hypothetical protein
MRIHTKAFAISAGIVCGGLVGIASLLGLYFNYGIDFLYILRSVYPGYTVSVLGSIIGALYGFLHGALVAGVISFIYNRIFVKL